ncbi:MAG TPA: asparagine synthase C-terminal domain-containing protein [Steroidobacteraceae bacterium]|nr:asparagine synthase C-terminal domain-containing protein [Steroidobacteraceae bacterium]
MFRYIALISDSSDSQQSDAAQAMTRRLKASSIQWTEALDRPGLRVLCTDACPGSLEPHLLPGKAGVVLGSLFTRTADLHDDAPASRCAMDDARTAAIVDSRGEWLIRNAWGNYVAFVSDPQTGHTWVLKDPCGSLPCFTTTFRGITITFSAIADCAELGPVRFTVNRRFLERRLYGGDLTQQSDALNEISQIHRGECVEFAPRRQPAIVARRFLWNPFRLARTSEPLDDACSAARKLRNTLRSCTSALAACHESVLLRLSGGLDSSIVLACLRASPRRPNLLSYTQYVPDSPLDPRRWARMAAAHSGGEHVEIESTAASVRLSAILEMAPMAEPVSTLMCLVTATHEQTLVARQGASATFTGDGGDCAFGSFCIGEAATAYLRRHGPRLAVIRLAAESASILQQTTWHALKRALQMWITGRSLTSLAGLNHEARKLVTQDVVRECEATPAVHPWLAGMSHAPWELISKLGMLLGTPDLYSSQMHPGAQAPQIVAPIYSQPFIELALRIPADVLFADGHDRGLARRAFRGDVPQPILNRLWKDRAGDFHDQIIHRNLDWLRETFLDGVLVSEGLLDKAAVERALAPGLVKSDVFPGELLRHLDNEIWARQWMARARGVLIAA